MISSMVMVLNHGQMVHAMRVVMRTVKKKDREDSLLLMEVTMKANSNKMKLVDLETTTGQMASLMLETGVKTRWMGKVSFGGKMERCTQVTS